MGTWVVEVLEFEGVGLSVVVLPRRRWPGQHLVQHGEPNEEVQGGAGSRRECCDHWGVVWSGTWLDSESLRVIDFFVAKYSLSGTGQAGCHCFLVELT